MTVVKKVDTTTILLPCIPSSSTSFVSLLWKNPGWALSHVINCLLTCLIVNAAYQFQDATSAMAFYGVYHREPMNQLIHFVGVPGIIYSIFIFQCHLPITNKVVIDFLPGIPNHYMNWATVWFLIYQIFYVTIDLFGAMLYFPFTYIMYQSAVRWVVFDQRNYYDSSSSVSKTSSPSFVPVYDWTGSKEPLAYASIIHFICWYVQIKLGHQMIEGAQPAVLQSVGGALSTAPLFAFYEGVWFLGIRTEFRDQVMEQVAIYTKELCQRGIQMNACSSVTGM